MNTDKKPHPTEGGPPFPSLKKSGDLQFIPEPYRAMIETIEPDDIYLVQNTQSGEPIFVRHIPANTPAHKAHEIEMGLSGPRLTVTKFRGRDLRSLFLELSRAHGHILGFATIVNPL